MMKTGYKIDKMDTPEWDIIGGGIEAYNTQQAGDDHGHQLCFVLKDPQGKIVGGVIGATYWNWLYINLMWIDEDLRGNGFGAQLLSDAEEEGRKRGAEFSHLDTFSFQAPGFYQKNGYEVFGVLDDFPTGHQRFFLKKALVGNENT
jgi:GNAT superfamily N-acetyltransferase